MNLHPGERRPPCRQTRPRWYSALATERPGAAGSARRNGRYEKTYGPGRWLASGTVGALLLALTGLVAASDRPEVTRLQCGNLIYAGTRSSVCFADRFLSEVAQQTRLQVNTKFCPVRLDADALFDYPFCVMSGNESFSLSEKERVQLRRFLGYGGFLLVSPGCSDEKWDKSFRQEIKVCFPQHSLKPISMNHPIFSIVNQIPRLADKNGKTVMLEGLEIAGRLVLVYSKEGLNDVEHAKGCCCCGGNEIRNPAAVNVNVFTYAVVY